RGPRGAGSAEVAAGPAARAGDRRRGGAERPDPGGPRLRVRVGDAGDDVRPAARVPRGSPPARSANPGTRCLVGSPSQTTLIRKLARIRARGEVGRGPPLPRSDSIFGFRFRFS